MYNTKMNTFLSDSNTYNLVINNNIAQYIQNKNNGLAKELKDLGLTDNNTYKELRCHNGTAAKMYV